jgi:TetR/AcrR family transcriptional regulator of autoinduction and epiphytic fitness
VTTNQPSDGRSALRAERRLAIIDAARALATEHGSDGFTVDQVALRAGVSRRTVFNHFAGLDQLLVAACEQLLVETTTELLGEVDRRVAALAAALPDDGQPVPGPDGRTVLAAVAESARGVDLPRAIASIHCVLGAPCPTDERAQHISRTAFEHVGGRLREHLQQRAPDLDVLNLELTLALMFSGINTLADVWLERHPDLTPDVPDAARADWDRLLDRLLDLLRLGHAD